MVRVVCSIRHYSAISETASLIFYMLVGYKFRPDFDNPYLMVQAAVWTGNAKS